MDFWVFIFGFCMLIPAVTITLGLVALFKLKERSKVLGYRTKLSMKNLDTWRFANRYIGIRWIIIGVITIPPSIAVMLFVREGDTPLYGIAGVIVFIVQCCLFPAPIVPTEMALRRTFDEQGRRLAREKALTITLDEQEEQSAGEKERETTRV
jgi:uncharacterized membrane protein